MALAARNPRPGLIHHSDRGVQYACGDYVEKLERHKIRAGSVRLNSFRVSISVVLPGLRCFLPHRGWDGGRA